MLFANLKIRTFAPVFFIHLSFDRQIRICCWSSVQYLKKKILKVYINFLVQYFASWKEAYLYFDTYLRNFRTPKREGASLSYALAIIDYQGHVTL